MRADQLVDVAETGVWFRSGSHELFGVLTTPRGGAPDTVTIVAAGGWYGTSTARNGSVVQVCRALAARGHAAMHFDYRGVGESDGTARFTLQDPYTDDLHAAVTAMGDRGFRRVALVGICYGSWVALLTAPRVPDLAALALVSFPPTTRVKRAAARVDHAASTGMLELVRRGLGRAGRQGLLHDRGVRRAARRAVAAKLRGGGPGRDVAPPTGAGPVTPPEVLAALGHVTGGGVPLLFLYSDRAPHHAEFVASRATGPLGPALAAGREGQVELVAVDSDIEEFARMNAQRTLTEELTRWLDRRLDRH